MAKNFEYFVEIEDVMLSDGTIRYSAQIPYVVKNPDIDGVHIFLGLGKSWGKTRRDAKEQAIKKVEKWLDKQDWVIRE